MLVTVVSCRGDEADLILLVVDSRELLSGRDRGRSLVDELEALVSSLLPGAPASSPRSPRASAFRSAARERPETDTDTGSAASPARVHLALNKSDLLDASEAAELRAAVRALFSPTTTTTTHERLPVPPSGTSASLLSCHTSEGLADLLVILTLELPTLYAELLLILYSTVHVNLNSYAIDCRTLSTDSAVKEHSSVATLAFCVHRCANPSAELATLTQARHRHHVRESARALERYLAAHALRTAASHIRKLTGVITTDELLDVIFCDFCIGK